MIHGFYGHSTGTWTDEDSGKCWPRDHVPDEMKQHIRVLTFGYYESYIRPYRREILSSHARDLLSHLNKSQQRRENGPRPIVWVAHSVGGIVVKEVGMRTVRNIAQSLPYPNPSPPEITGPQHRGAYSTVPGHILCDSWRGNYDFPHSSTVAHAACRSSLLLPIIRANPGARSYPKSSKKPRASNFITSSSQTHARCWTERGWTPKGWTRFQWSLHACQMR